MSSSPSNDTKRLRSISRRLSSRIIGQKLSVCLGHDFLLFILIMCTWFLTAEYMLTGDIDFKDRNHKIDYISELSVDESDESFSVFGLKLDTKDDNALSEHIKKIDSKLRYIVLDKDSEIELVNVRFYRGMMNVLAAVFVIYIFQVIIYWMGYPVERAKVKSVLNPIYELTRKADELAKFEYTEDKYQLIEEQLTNIEPDDQKKIHLGDEDLIGIENAMNSLIQRIHESNRQQARFVNDASHELRTPIAVIEGYANMLARWGKEDEQVLDESITAIQNESANMKHLVEQLLFLARGDAGRTVIDKKQVSLNNIMQEVYEESLMIDEQHIYKLNICESNPQLMADEGLIKQSVRILVDNAAKYTKEKDEIILSVGTDAKGIGYLQVQDSGIGMKSSDVEHMFERFYRADKARSFNGTGLGLSIAKWIVEKHGGHFEITSREEIGTRIRICFSEGIV